jgi:hypothetical protein
MVDPVKIPVGKAKVFLKFAFVPEQ